MKVELIINGDPQGKGRPRFTKNGHTYTPSATTTYEHEVILSYKDKYKDLKLFENDEPIFAIITAYYKVPSSEYKFYKKLGKYDYTKTGKAMLSGAIRPTKKPDTDNIAKIVLDALNEIAYDDDKQIVGLLVLKYYAEEPRVEITLERAR